MTPTYYVQHPDGSYSVADPQPQQDGTAKPASEADMAVYRDIAANYHKDRSALAQQDHRRTGCTAGTDEECVRRDCGAKCPALAQQDAQAVPLEPCAVVKWQTGGPVVHIIGEVQVGDLLYRAAPTPPAQRVMLTPEEVTEVIVDCYGYSADIEFHECLVRAAIEAYEKKNGIK